MTPHERRVARRLEARGQHGLAEALVRLRGTPLGPRFRLAQLYAVGAEGAVFDVAETGVRGKPLHVAKLALHPVHRPFDLDPDDIRRRRYGIRVEAQYLLGNSSPFMPRGEALFEIENPLLDVARGGAFGEPEPVVVMEKLPGHDLDRWLARTHRSGTDRATMRRTLDRIAVVVIQALTDLRRRGVYFADLRPGNMRMLGHPSRRVRMLDAGSLVSVHDRSGRFPHVPAYLPPDTFVALRRGERVTPTDEIQAIMAGRTLYECATGSVPRPGEDLDLRLLEDCNVSRPVAQIIIRLSNGRYTDVREALRHLADNATRRVRRGNDPRLADAPVLLARESGDHAAARAALRAHPAAPDVHDGDGDVLPPAPPARGLVARLVRRLLRRA